MNDKPSMICCKTVIGYGAPNLCGSHDCHGAALGDAEVAATREPIGWKHAPFVIPQDIYAGWDAKSKGADGRGKSWNDKFAVYKKALPDLAAEYERRIKGGIAQGLEPKGRRIHQIRGCQGRDHRLAQGLAERAQWFGPALPEFLGGSADLAGSNLTIWKGSKGISNTVSDGNYILLWCA